jgi:hypothetical protein
MNILEDIYGILLNICSIHLQETQMIYPRKNDRNQLYVRNDTAPSVVRSTDMTHTPSVIWSPNMTQLPLLYGVLT